MTSVGLKKPESFGNAGSASKMAVGSSKQKDDIFGAGGGSAADWGAADWDEDTSGLRNAKKPAA